MQENGTEADVSMWPPISESVRRAEQPLEQKFRELVHRWKRERRPTSSASRMAANPAYRQIIEMGLAVVPLLLAELERQPDHWFIALHELTGADPVPKESRGRLNEMVDAWVRWGKENGIKW